MAIRDAPAISTRGVALEPRSSLFLAEADVVAFRLTCSVRCRTVCAVGPAASGSISVLLSLPNGHGQRGELRPKTLVMITQTTPLLLEGHHTG